MSATRPRVVIVSPALADANNGNWQTAQRWQQMLAPRCDVRIVREWPDSQASPPDDAMLALHARRSAGSIARWAKSRPHEANAPGLAVVLTGTDLYQDILVDPTAQASLSYGERLVVLQGKAPDALPAQFRHKARVIYQSTSALPQVEKTPRHLRAVMVGHLRDEKSPQTLFAAARLLDASDAVFIDHIGGALDAALGDAARGTAAECPHYRWLGELEHTSVRRHIQRAHVLVHTSRLEGGAHVIMEAVRCGTPVIASRMDGNVGMLGDDYAGYFDFGDAKQLADLLGRCRAGQLQPESAQGHWLAQLRAQCALRAACFTPEAEGAALHGLMDELLSSPLSSPS
ncbi:MAG: selenoneine biosynthesis selenosugar synthase SenB [Pseudomonadota bacterium]